MLIPSEDYPGRTLPGTGTDYTPERQFASSRAD